MQVVLVLFTSDTTTKQDPIAPKDEWGIDSRTPSVLKHRHTDTSCNRTPAQAFLRKTPPVGESVLDEQTGEEKCLE